MANRVTYKRLIIGAVVVVVLVFTGIGFYWNIEPDPLTPPERDDHPVGWVTTTQLINSINTLLDKPGGYLINDVMPPGDIMDNMPSWEYGALIELRAFTGILRTQIARPQAQSVRDPDLARAYPKLNVDHKSWLFPRDESSYHEAVEYLEHYRLRLEGKEEPKAYFLNRPNNLDPWLQIVSQRLGGLTQELEQVGAESGNSGLFKDAQERQPLENLPPGQRPPPGSGPPTSGQGQPPPMTEPDGQLPRAKPPNHPLTMAPFMASANSTEINIRRLVIAD